MAAPFEPVAAIECRPPGVLAAAAGAGVAAAVAVAAAAAEPVVAWSQFAMRLEVGRCSRR